MRGIRWTGSFFIHFGRPTGSICLFASVPNTSIAHWQCTSEARYTPAAPSHDCDSDVDIVLRGVLCGFLFSRFFSLPGKVRPFFSCGQEHRQSSVAGEDIQWSPLCIRFASIMRPPWFQGLCIVLNFRYLARSPSHERITLESQISPVFGGVQEEHRGPHATPEHNHSSIHLFLSAWCVGKLFFSELDLNRELSRAPLLHRL
ncbi:hypothetical protein R3P38DRAFT_822373 [Favolaschia claudopus]|uniref:Uncharacterized protein n=1 Tax=Favolaschia claudopus TaxID=2862362 RepID=A0AAW0BXN7_9AGAR